MMGVTAHEDPLDDVLAKSGRDTGGTQRQPATGSEHVKALVQAWKASCHARQAN